MNPLTDIIPAAGRRYVYALYALGTLVLSCLALVDVATLAGVELVKWVGVWGLIGTAVGATAASNVPGTAPARDEAGNADVTVVLIVAALVGVVLLLFGIRF